VTGKPCFEDVVTLPEVSEIFGCHLRIWERSDRAIVLAGNLKDLPIPQSRIEECVDEIARLYLRDARPFDFYIYYADREIKRLPYLRIPFDVDEGRRRSTAMVQRIRSIATRSPLAARPEDLAWGAFLNPRWHSMSLDEFRHLAGVAPDEYEGDLYTADIVRSYLQTGMTMVPWDPYFLARSLAEVKSLDAIITTTGDQRLRELLSVAAATLRSDSRAIKVDYEHEREKPAFGILARQYPELTDDDWELLDSYGKNRPAPWSEDFEGLEAIRELLQDIKESGNPSNVCGVALAALERAERIITSWRKIMDDDFRERERQREVPAFRASDVLYVAGDADRAYLETIHWTAAPGCGEEQCYADLVKRLSADAMRLEAMRIRKGCDPFGRAIVHAGDYFGMEAYVVEWPQEILEEPYPDTAIIVANNIYSGRPLGGRPAYINYESGRCDLLPAADYRSGMPGFTWGYGGTGPGLLKEAIKRACCSNIPAPESRFFRWWMDSVVSTGPEREEFKISVGEVRHWYKDEQSSDELLDWKNGKGSKIVSMANFFGWELL
jgi:hypothetical protein